MKQPKPLKFPEWDSILDRPRATYTNLRALSEKCQEYFSWGCYWREQASAAQCIPPGLPYETRMQTLEKEIAELREENARLLEAVAPQTMKDRGSS